jgi:hypothetical protein
VTGNADHRQPPQTISDSDLWRKPWKGCFRLPPGLSIFYIVFLLCSNISLTSLISIYSQTPVLCTPVLKSNSFTLNFLSLSFWTLVCPSEIRTFRCYEGTAHKLRPSPFRIFLQSLESAILLPELKSDC